MDLACANDRLINGTLGSYTPTMTESADKSLDPDTPVADVQRLCLTNIRHKSSREQRVETGPDLGPSYLGYSLGSPRL